MQQILRAAVQRGAGHNVRACAHQCGNTQVQGRLAAGHGNGPNAAFKRRHALLKYRVGGVADAAINVACTL